MPTEVRVAAIAVATVDGLPGANYLRAARLVEIALSGAPDIILLPEAFAAGYCSCDLTPFAEASTSASLERFRQLSAQGSCMIVLGFLEKIRDGIRNAVVLYDRGRKLGMHRKRTLWPDAQRRYRDETTLMLPGTGMEIFATRFGKCSVVICYENMVEENWAEVGPHVDFILSPYNCQGDPAHNNVEKSRQYAIPSAWADRTGTVWAGDHYMPNLGTAGIVDATGNVVAQSTPGVETIVTGAFSLEHAAGAGAR